MGGSAIKNSHPCFLGSSLYLKNRILWITVKRNLLLSGNHPFSPKQFAFMRKTFKLGLAPFPCKLLTTLSVILFFSATAFCQIISGTIHNASNQPLAGVTVQVKNTA